MNKSEAKELLDSFELYAHDEYGETFVSQIKDDFLKWKYGNDQDVGVMEIKYFGTSLSECGHYRWILKEDRTVYMGLKVEDLPFNPEELTNNLKKGEIIYYQGGGFTVIGIAGSCTDPRPGTESIFWVNEIFNKEEMIRMIKNNPMAAKIINAMSFNANF